MDKNKIFSIPNVLSFLRIVMIPFIVWQFLAGNEIIAVLLIALSALTDVIDGFVARRFNMITPLGKALDPIADKATLITLVACLCFKFKAMIVLLVICVVKELIMGIEGLLVIKKTGTTYSSKWFGKVATAVLYLTILLHVWWAEIPDKLSNLLVLVCQILAVLSVTLYTISNVKVIKDDNASEDTEVEKR